MAKAIPEPGKRRRSAGRVAAGSGGANPRRQRLWRDIALIVIAPLLVYLFASLVTHSPTDPGWFSQPGAGRSR